MMRKWINNHFNFTRSEFNGILALFILIVAITALPRIYVLLWPDKPGMEEMAEIQKLDLKEQFKKLEQGQKSPSANAWKKKVHPKAFDPNTLDQQGWENLGLSTKQARAVRNYVAKGGKFYKTEDLKKIYTISPEVYNKLAPYVEIKNIEAPHPEHRYPTPVQAKKTLMVYEINNLDTTGMQAIKGIGPAFARRIFKYRERLGGFHQPEQLMEVFGLDSTKFSEIKGQIRVDEGALKKININTVEFDGLKQHPYLSYKQVNAIIQYRKQHGNYSSFADLKKVAILPAETVDKLAPYLSF